MSHRPSLSISTTFDPEISIQKMNTPTPKDKRIKFSEYDTIITEKGVVTKVESPIHKTISEVVESPKVDEIQPKISKIPKNLSKLKKNKLKKNTSDSKLLKKVTEEPVEDIKRFRSKSLDSLLDEIDDSDELEVKPMKKNIPHRTSLPSRSTSKIPIKRRSSVTK